MRDAESERYAMESPIVCAASDSEQEPLAVGEAKQTRSIPAKDLVKRHCLCTARTCFRQFLGKEAEVEKFRAAFQSMHAYRKETCLHIFSLGLKMWSWMWVIAVALEPNQGAFYLGVVWRQEP